MSKLGRRDSYFVECAQTVLHTVRMPDIMETGFKGQARAFANFTDAEVERVAEDHLSGRKEVRHWFSAMREREWESNKEIYSKFINFDLREVEHASIFDFFEAIGYDKKTKKYEAGAHKVVDA